VLNIPASIFTEERQALEKKYPECFIVLSGLFGEVLDISPKCKEIIGFYPEEMIARANLENMCNPEDLSTVLSGISNAVSHQKSSIHLIFRILTKLGKYLWIEAEFHILMRDDQPKFLLQICREYQVKHGSAIDDYDLRSFAEISESRFLAKLSLKGDFRWVSPSCILITGHSPLELAGTNVYDYIYELDISAIKLAHARACSGEGHKQVVPAFRFKMQNGNYVLCSTMVEVFKSSESDQFDFMVFNTQKIQIEETSVKGKAEGFKVCPMISLSSTSSMEIAHD
jgi:PAS domain S-box-containing protein